MATTPQRASVDLGFLFVGGMHQAMHMAPVALALARRAGVGVTAYVPPEGEGDLRALLDRLDPAGGACVTITAMRLPIWARLVAPARKVLALFAWRRRLLGHDALVAAERSSTLLKRLPGRRPVMIHIPHGAGDRARGFDPRIRLFDHVLVNGDFVRDRTLAEKLALPEAMTVIGSLKLAALIAAPPPPRPFADERPVVLYNPHFDTDLSSWRLARPLVEAIVGSGRFNLLVAPHARLGAALDAAEREWWLTLGRQDGVHVDLGSAHLGDMTYTRAADIYLGDVSSQLYEFLHHPRPAVFVDAHRVAWAGDADYRMWTLGEVAETADGALAALDRSVARHAEFRDMQRSVASDVLGPVDAGVPDRAADALLAALDRLSPPRARG